MACSDSATAPRNRAAYCRNHGGRRSDTVRQWFGGDPRATGSGRRVIWAGDSSLAQHGLDLGGECPM